VYDVIFQKGQFPPAYKSGFKELVPPDECIIAAKMALEGVNNIGNCLYFNNRPFTSRSGTFYKKIEGEYFLLLSQKYDKIKLPKIKKYEIEDI